MGEPAAEKIAKMQRICLRIFGGSEPPPYEGIALRPYLGLVPSFAAGDIMRGALSFAEGNIMHAVPTPSASSPALREGKQAKSRSRVPL